MKTRYINPSSQHEDEFTIKAISPFYLIESSEICYKCGISSKVISFGAFDYEPKEYEEDGCDFEEKEGDGVEPVKFMYVTDLPNNIEKLIEVNCYNYFVDHSQTNNSYYYMNHCEYCNTKFGDNYLHKPEHAFFPQTEQEASKILLTELKSDGFARLNADVSLGIMQFIVHHSTKQTTNSKRSNNE